MSFETLVLDFPPYLQCKDKYEWILLTAQHHNIPIEKVLENVAKKGIQDKELEKQKYTQGVYINKLQTKYGDMFKISIDIDKFTKENKMTYKGYIHFLIKQAKSGKFYAENSYPTR